MSGAIVSKASQKYSASDTNYILNKSDLWLDFSDSTCYTLTSATRVATVVDKSSTPKTVTKTGTALFYDQVGKGIRFSSGNYLTASLSSPGITGATAQETGFAVVDTFTNSSNSAIIGGSLNTRNIRLGTQIAYSRTGSGAPATGVTTPTGIKYLISWVLLNGSVTVYYNGGFDSTGAVTFTVQETTQQIGQSQGSSTYSMQGSLFEMILFGTTALTDSQIRIINYYLMEKWKIPTTNIISSPLSVSGCTLWLDGNDAATITYGVSPKVSQWNDKSGNNYHATQSTASKQPTYDTTLKGLKFTNTSLTGFITSAPWSLTETLFVVVNLGARQTVIGTGTNASTTKGRNLRIGSANPPLLLSNDTTLITGTVNVTDTTSRFIFEYYYNNSTTTAEITRSGIQDGEINTALTIASNTYNTIGASKSATDGDNYDSYIYEVIVFNSALSVTDRTSIYKYLTNKWSTTNGPVKSGKYAFNLIPPSLRYFNPLDFSGLLVWLDASDTTTISYSSGTNISQWNDKSGNSNNAVAGNSPVSAANTLNGLTTIQLRGSSDYFLVSNNLTTTTYPSLCYFIVLNISSSQPTGVTRGGILSTNTSGIFGRSLGITGGSYEEEYYSNYVSLTTYSAGSWAIAVLQFNSTAATTFTLNGTSFTGTASGTGTNTTGLKIGAYNSSGAPAYTTTNANFDVAEILVYGLNLGFYQRQVIEGYLAWKWGLRSNLPSTHQFKTIPPYFDIFDIRSLNVSITLWLDAADTSSNSMTLSGSVVTTWKDKSGNGFSGTSSGSPPLISKIQNGLPAISFDGSTQYFDFGNVNNMGTNQLNIFVVAKYNSGSGASADGSIIAKSLYGIATARYAIYRQTGVLVPALQGSTTSYQGSGATDSSTATRIIGMVWDRTTDYLYLNGTQAFSVGFSDAASLTSTYNLLVGAYNSASGGLPPGSGLYFNGYIMEVIQVLGVVSTTQRQQIEGYLGWKWGLQSSLPSTHPYYKFPPF